MKMFNFKNNKLCHREPYILTGTSNYPDQTLQAKKAKVVVIQIAPAMKYYTIYHSKVHHPALCLQQSCLQFHFHSPQR